MLKAVPWPYPNPKLTQLANPDEMWSKSILMGLSFYRINLRIMRTELKDGHSRRRQSVVRQSVTHQNITFIKKSEI